MKSDQTTKELGEVRRDIIHHMGRRCRDWDYGGRAIYMITINLKERGRPVMAEWPRASPETAKIYMPLTPLGEKVLSCWRRIPEFWLMVELLECQVMPDHFHGLLFVKGALLSSSGRPKTLGDVVRGFKTGCREVGWEEGYVDNILFREGQLKRMADYIRDNPRRLAEKRANPRLFRHVADLTIDLLVSEQAQNRPVSGQAQNRPVSEQAQNRPVSGKAQNQLISGQAQNRATARPEQLQLFPEHDLRQPGNRPMSASAEMPRFCASAETARLCASAETARFCASAETARFCASPETAKSFRAHFSAIGNAALLRWPVILQVQCSRSDFRYQRVRLATGGWKILRNAAGEPLVEYASPAFEAKCEDALRCAKNGAALISPCISHGEREIARRAHLAGMRVIALCNKGFSKFEKPNGALFDQCAKGNLLMLAPAAWPYVPGEKPPTRESSLVLNRIAQLIAGEGRAEIKYNGMVLKDIDSKVRAALRPQLESVYGSVSKEEADFVRKSIAEQHVIDEEMWK